MEIDSLVNVFNHKTTVIWKPKLNFINDINTIINELNNKDSYINLDIYDILVSCGHNLTWDQEYYLSIDDFNWFKNEEGKIYFLNNLNKNNKIFCINEYNAIIEIHLKLVELFELQLET